MYTLRVKNQTFLAEILVSALLYFDGCTVSRFVLKGSTGSDVFYYG